jgi:hypothetical protein
MRLNVGSRVRINVGGKSAIVRVTDVATSKNGQMFWFKWVDDSGLETRWMYSCEVRHVL